MKSIFLPFICFLSLTVHGQTAIIAHKNHSGKEISFFTDPSTNFGEIEMPYVPPSTLTEEFSPLNDSVMILEVKDSNQTVIRRELLSNKMRYSQVVFEYKYLDSVRLKQLEEDYRLEQQMLEQNQEMEQKTNAVPAKSKKGKGFLLFLLGIPGGGLLLSRLFRRSASLKHPMI